MPDFPDPSKTLYDELHRIAANKLRVHPNRSLQPTLLVHEAFVRLAKQDQTWNDRTDLRRAAARVMRFVLVDHIRARNAEIHGGKVKKVPIEMTLPGQKEPVSAEEFMALHKALDDMATEHPDHVEVVVLRYFSGLTVKEVAATLDIGVSTVERRWRFARAWLRARISKG